MEKEAIRQKEAASEKAATEKAAQEAYDATERLKDLVNEETCEKILKDSEDMVKQSFLKAIESKVESEYFDKTTACGKEYTETEEEEPTTSLSCQTKTTTNHDYEGEII